MYRARPMWIASRVPERITCMHCHDVDSAVLTTAADDGTYEYSCQACKSDVKLSLEELNNPVWRERMKEAKAA